MQVAEHLIAVPAEDHLGDVIDNAGTDERRGYCSSEGSRVDIIALKAQVWAT